MAIAVRTGAILVFLSVFPGAERVSGQRAPCYQCEDYKEKNPQTSPYQQVRQEKKLIAFKDTEMKFFFKIPKPFKIFDGLKEKKPRV